ARRSAQHLSGDRAPARPGVARNARRTGRPAAAAVERIASVRVHAGPVRAHGLPRRAARAAGRAVADLPRLASGGAATAVAAVGRYARAVAAQQPGLALAGTALTALAGGARLAAAAAVLRIGG